MYYGYKITRPMVSDKRVREAMNIAINRADIVKGIMLGNAEPAYTFVDPKALDFAEKTKGIIKEDVERAKKLLDEAGWKVGSRRHPRKGRRQARAQGAVHAGLLFPARIRSDPGLHAQDRRRLEDRRLRLHDRACRNGQAGLRTVDRDGTLPVGGRTDELLFQLAQHPDAEPDELEGRRRPTSGCAPAAPR